MKKHRRTYEELNLDKKIQYLIWTLAIPMVFCILLPVVSMFISIGNYSTITHNMNLSSDFSLNFKENMDLNMYHYCVGSAEQKTLPRFGRRPICLPFIPWAFVERLWLPSLP